jgi:hypothetical protein
LIIRIGRKAEEEQVPAYRFYLIDGRGRVIDVRDASCEDDETAEAVARDLIAANRRVSGVETWLRPRLVSKVGRGQRIVSDSAYAGARPRSRK